MLITRKVASGGEPASGAFTVGKIYEAMRRCVGECGNSETPFLCVAKFCDRLRDDETWTGEEVERVEQGAWRTLQAVSV